MVSYTYYDNGLVDERRHGNGTVVKHEYDGANRLTKITHWPGTVGQGNPLDSFAYQYDAHGNRTRLTFADNSYIQFYYNSIDELEVEVWREADGTEYRRIEYFYDPNGNRTRRVLTEYENGNPVVTTTDYEHNAGNQVTEATTGSETITFQHDNNGNLTEKQEATGTTVYAWDYDDRLTGITFPDLSTNAFGYNGQHRRVEKEDSEGTKKYEWDGLNVLLERDGSGNFQMRYTQGLTPVAGIGANVARRDSAGDDVWFHQDGVGSTRRLTDSTPTTVRTYAYDAFGNVLATAGTDGTAYRFTGKESDVDSGLIYFGARYYDPGLGRFISQDWIDKGPNRYAYCANNPVNGVDPEGLEGVYVGRVYVIKGTIKGDAVSYTGSSAQELRARFSTHRWTSLIEAESTSITTYEVKAELDIAGSGRGTLRSARNEALRAAEQKVLSQMGEVKGVRVLNDRLAATRENAAKWTKQHSVEMGRETVFQGGVELGANAALLLLDIFRMYLEEKMSQYVMAPYLLEDEHGVFMLQVQDRGIFRSDYYYKNYQTGPLKGKAVQIDRDEFNVLRKEAEALWGTTDWKGDWVPGILRRELPVIYVSGSGSEGA
jgi:RHS repeat-associated protein